MSEPREGGVGSAVDGTCSAASGSALGARDRTGLATEAVVVDRARIGTLSGPTVASGFLLVASPAGSGSAQASS